MATTQITFKSMQDLKISIKNHHTNLILGTYTVNLTEHGVLLSGKFAQDNAFLKLINPSGSAISVQISKYSI